MAAKAKVKKTVQIKQQPKISDNFKDMTIGDMTITFRKDTNRYTLKKGEEFILSDINLGVVVRTANEKSGIQSNEL